MKYNRYTIKTTVEAEDIVAAELDGLGVEGVEIEDGVPLSESEKAEMFVDIPPEPSVDDGSARVSFYLDSAEDNEVLLDNIRNALYSIRDYCDAGELSISVSELADEDYLNSWKQYFHRFTIDDILFIPSWEWEELKEKTGEPLGEEDLLPDGASMVIHIDPGTAFGTGKHETTRLCIQALRKYVKKGDSVLDVGAGSGILSLMAFKFGAKTALGTDLDRAAIEACRANLENNGLGESDFELLIGNIIDDEEIQERAGYGKYDIVCANILAQVLIPLTPEVCRHIKKGGIYITSGIIDEKEKEVSEAVQKAGFEILEINRLGEWVCIVAKMQDR